MSRTRLGLALVAALAAVGSLGVWAYVADRGPGGVPPVEGVAPPARTPPTPRPPNTASGRGVYPFDRVVVLSIGINRYPKVTGAPDLRFAEADAEALAELARTRYGYEAVTLLGPGAGRRGIELAIKRHGGDLGGNDAFIVFFAGHGQVVERPDHGAAGYLVPADADLDLGNRTDFARWADQALDMEAIVALADGLPAKHVLVIADACCSGFMPRRGGLSRWDLKTLLTARSRTALAATTARQFAREDAHRGHGYFTAALLEELAKDGASSVFDVHAALLKAVGERTNGRMTPQLAQFGDGDGAFVFVPSAIPREEIERDLADLGPAEPGAVKGLKGVAARVRNLVEQQTRPEEAFRAVEIYPYVHASNPETARPAWEERFQRFLRNAGAGEPWAMLAVHLCYAKGLGTKRDPEQALHWARQAARADKPAGLREYLLARCYDLGLGVDGPAAARQAQALSLLESSARAGFGLGKRAVARELIWKRPKDPKANERAKALLEGAVRDGVRRPRGTSGGSSTSPRPASRRTSRGPSGCSSGRPGGTTRRRVSACTTSSRAARRVTGSSAGRGPSSFCGGRRTPGFPGPYTTSPARPAVT